MSHPLFFLGSLPYETVPEAIAFVKEHSKALPFLPQLPEANPQEDMVGQVLRGIELGCWDELASSCLELFQNEFVDFSRVKIQVAGPMTVSRSLSSQFGEISPSWLVFWAGLYKQLSQGGFKNEIWLQIDEPFWSKETPLPVEYLSFLGDVKKTGTNLKVGLHSCHKNRPEMDEVLVPFTDFFSFNFLHSPLDAGEIALWTQLFDITPLQLVLGTIEPGKDPKGIVTPFDGKVKDRIWLSPPCGLYDWTKEEIEKTFSVGSAPQLAGNPKNRIEPSHAKKG